MRFPLRPSLLILLLGFAGTASAHRRHHVFVDPFWDPFWGWGPRYSTFPGRWAVVDTDVSPESADVYLDGERIGLADDFDGFPDFLYLEAGTYKLEFRRPGFEPLETTLRVEAGRKYDFDDRLERSEGAGHIDSAPTGPRATTRRFSSNDADDEDDDRPTDRRPRRERIRVEVVSPDADEPGNEDRDDDGEVVVEELRGDDGETRIEKRTIRRRVVADDDSDEPAPPPAEERKPSPREATVRLSIEPADATVFLDGRKVGEAGSIGDEMSLPPGEHEILVVAPGHASKSSTIEVGPGDVESLRIRLRPIS